MLDGDGRNAVFDHVYVHAGDARNFADFFTHAHGAVVAGEAGCFDGGGAALGEGVVCGAVHTGMQIIAGAVCGGIRRMIL